MQLGRSLILTLPFLVELSCRSIAQAFSKFIVVSSAAIIALFPFIKRISCLLHLVLRLKAASVLSV